MAKITSKIPLYTTSFLVLFLAIVPFTFAYTEISKSAMVNNIVTFTPSGSYPNNKANPQYNFDSDVGLGKRTGWEQSGGDGYAQKYYHYYFNGSGKAIARWQYYGINNNSVGGGLYIQYSDDNITWTNATGLYAWQTGYRNITVSSPSVHNHWRIGVKPTHTFGNYYDLSLSEQWFFEESPEVWLVPYQYRLAIDCSSLDQNQPFLINGTQGFYIDGYHQLIWTRCIDDLYLYYNDHTDYLIGTETTRIGQEVELGTGTSYNVTDVWNSDYSAVYHLTETGSTYYDSTSNDNDGTLTGSPNQNVSCVIAGCVDIQQSDGDDYITVPDSASLDLTDVTIEAWVQIESPTGYGDSPIVIKGDIFGMNYHFGVTDSDGTLQVNDAGALHKSDTGQNQDQFYYVAMTRNSTKVYYFRNETTDGEDTVNVGSTNNDNLYIGFDGDSGTYGGRYDGKLDEVRVLNNNKDSSYFYKNYQNYQTVSSYGTVEDFQINTADLTPPTITINAPINNSLIKQRVFINLTIDELGDCTIYNNQFYIYSENQTFFSFYDYNLSNDAHSINIKCNDTTGNNAYSNINFSKLDDYADPIITYNFPTDTTGIKFNINMWINITTNETANCFLDSVNFTETNNFTLYYDDGLFHSWNEDNLTNGNYTININCSDPSDNSVLETIYFYKDIVSPAIVFNTPQNLEEVENTGLLSLNIDISDDSDLYNFKINISDNTTVYFNDIVNISGLEYNYLTNVNLENFTNSSDYRIMARACDSHTKNELKKIYLSFSHA